MNRSDAPSHDVLREEILADARRQAKRLIRNAPLCQVMIERLPILLKTPWKWGKYKIIDHALADYVGACNRNL